MAHILIVDDDASGREALGVYLERASHSVRYAAGGRAALNSIVANPPDLVVLDLHLPEMDGAGLLEVLRSYVRLQTIPVIIWTGAVDSPVLDRARDLKVDAILMKPQASLEQIHQAIQQQLQRAAQ